MPIHHIRINVLGRAERVLPISAPDELTAVFRAGRDYGTTVTARGRSLGGERVLDVCVGDDLMNEAADKAGG